MLRFLSIAFLVTSVLAALPPAAQAQHFHIDFGHHHGHHGHHRGWHFDHCWHGHCYDPWYPRYVYAYPPPVVRERVTYVEREPALSRAPAAVESRITLDNAAANRVSVAFLLDAQEVELRSGETRTFTGRGTRVVEFDRGGNFGTARYDLTEGAYEFVPTAKGWDLTRKSSAAASTAWRSTPRKNALPPETTTR